MKSFKIVAFICFSFISHQIFTQQRIIKGFVTDSLKQPIENATLLATPINNETQNIKYAITNAKGVYNLELLKAVNYKLALSCLGYKNLFKTIMASDNTNTFNFSLIEQKLELDEIVINYKYEAIERKKDTLIYNLQAFTNGNENKLEDVLNKLPGVKIDDNLIKVNGKIVTKLLVDDKLFFGGSTKLAIENIPADVMAKIEIISDYTEAEILKDIANPKDLALNVVLKEDKKEFVFGAIEAGYGFNDFYVFHPSLFKYKPKLNISFIGDINNFNSNSLSFSDLIRLSGGIGNLLNKNRVSADLLDHTKTDKNKLESKTKFSALNFYNQINEKLDIEGYIVYSSNDFVNKQLFENEYLSDNNSSFFETKDEFKTTHNQSATLNFKADYSPNDKSRFTYGSNVLYNQSNFDNIIISSSDKTNTFLNTDDAKNYKFSQYLEGFKKINTKHTLGFALNYTTLNSNLDANWGNDEPFLEGYFPLQDNERYQINKQLKNKAHKLNVLFKDYWLVSTFHHVFGSLGYTLKNTKITTKENQILSDDSIVDFSENNDDFGNNLKMILSDFNAELGVKSKFNKFLITLSASPHYYKLRINQNENSLNSKLFIEPKVDVLYNVGLEESLQLLYAYSNTYKNASKYLRNKTITSYNSVFQGNPNLLDEKFHSLSLDYSNYISKNNFFIDLGVDYEKKQPQVNTTIILNGINSLSLPVLIDLPETSLSFNAVLGREIKNTFLDFSFIFEWSKTNLLINSTLAAINEYDYWVSTKWLINLNKKTHFTIQYKANINNVVENNESSTFTENIITSKLDCNLFKNITFKTDVSLHFVNDYTNKNNSFVLPNIYLNYKKPNSKFNYGLVMENIFDNGVIFNNSFSKSIISSQKVFTLPAVFLAKLNYKF